MPSSGKTATLKAFTCMICGYTELYADDKGLENIKNGCSAISSNPYQQRILEGKKIIYCHNCGKKIFKTDHLCPDCGTEQK